MTTKLPASFLPAKFQVLSGSALKLIAITLMLIDHTGLMILYNYPASNCNPFQFRRRGLQLVSDFPGYRQGCFSNFLFSVSGRISAYT